MRFRPAVMCLVSFSMLWPAPSFVPVAAAQGATAPPPAEPGGAEIDTIPPNTIVLSLKECIQKALEDNIQIAVQKYDPETTQELVSIAQSEFDPLLTGSAYSSNEQQRQISSFVGAFSASNRLNAYGAQWLDPLTFGGSYQINIDASGNEFENTNQLGSSSNTGYSTDWKLTYRLPLLRGLGRQVNTSNIVVAQNTLGISESVFRQTVLDTVAAAVKAYADMNFAILQLRTSRFSLKLAQDFLAQNRIKVRVGTLAPIEITQAEAQVADREEAVIIFEAALRAAEDNIRRVIGMRKDSTDWERPIRPSDPLILEEFEPNEETALTAALAHRPDLEQARLDLQSRETELRARQNLRRWGLDFEGTYGNQGFSTHQLNDLVDDDGNPLTPPVPIRPGLPPDEIIEHGSYSDSVDDLQDRNQTSWSAGLFLSVPIFNRLAISNYGVAKNRLAQSELNLAQVEQEARLEVRSSVRAVETNLKRVKASEVNVRLQHEKLDAEQKKFENGMSTSFQVLQFQDDLSNAETRENLAKADYNKSLAELERVKGTLLDRFGITLQRADATGRAAGRSAAERFQWSRPEDLWQDPGLRIAGKVSESVRLPTEFVFERGRVVPVAADR